VSPAGPRPPTQEATAVSRDRRQPAGVAGESVPRRTRPSTAGREASRVALTNPQGGPEDAGMHVSELWRYPVKSMAGEPLEQAIVGPLGVEGDRIVHVEDVQGRVATARTHPRLLGHKARLDVGHKPLVDDRPWTGRPALARRDRWGDHGLWPRRPAVAAQSRHRRCRGPCGANVARSTRGSSELA
jgi:MOSC N-terminal beta barrel domain